MRLRAGDAGALRLPEARQARQGVVLRFLIAVTGISRKQMERLVRQWRDSGTIRDRRGGNRGRPLVRKYAAADIRLLVEVDEAFGQMSGLFTREVLRRQFQVFGDARFARLAAISNGHVYNLRNSATYRAKRTAWTRTRAATVAIGLRQAPEPEGRPGHVTSGESAARYGITVVADDPNLVSDPTGDSLDALLCAVQGAWAWRDRARLFGHRRIDPLEGWIADPQGV